MKLINLVVPLENEAAVELEVPAVEPNFEVKEGIAETVGAIEVTPGVVQDGTITPTKKTEIAVNPTKTREIQLS